MGCTQSKIENEEAVSRCKERKQFMKEAVSSRNAFAAAHSAHAMALKNTGAALSDYAHGEVLNPQLAQSTTNPPTQPFDSIRPPPPFPEMPLAPPPLQRAVTMPEFSIPQPDTKPPHPVIIEEENEDEIENDGSSGSSSLRQRSSRGNNRSVGDDDGAPPQPPSPPRPLPNNHHRDLPPPPQPPKESPWDFGDFFFSAAENMPGPSLSEVEEEVSSGKDEIERKVFDERSTRVKDSRVEAQEPSKAVEPPPKAVKNVRQSSSALANVEGKRSGKGAANVNLLKMLNDLDDHFLKASESAHEVSNMLEANRVHYHSNFADGRGHIDHSARVMRVITWNRSFKGLLNADDGKDDFDSEERETHATVLDKLLAWEKKLYDEVKAGELMKFEYQRKVTLLNKQKKRSTNSEALEKTKAAVSHLHTRYIVDMQSMDSTVSEINRLRDDQLYPKLVELVEGMATMWETMRVQHESQSNIVEDLKYLGISQSSKETSEHHHERTIQLWAVVEGWHAQFAKLVINQKDYIKALNNWLKLNLIPIESSLKEKVSSPPRPQNPPIQALLRAWHDYLDKLPDDHAKSAIFNFGAVIHSIVQYQEDEIKLKEKCEDTRKELARKTRQFEDWYNKYMQRRTPPDEMDPDRAEDNTHKDVVAEKQFAVDTVKKRLEEEEAAYLKQCLQVREKSLTSLKTRLPELFRALSDFARSCSDMYRNLSSISQFQNPSESSS